jgi:hypothetical protein
VGNFVPVWSDALSSTTASNSLLNWILNSILTLSLGAPCSSLPHFREGERGEFRSRLVQRSQFPPRIESDFDFEFKRGDLRTCPADLFVVLIHFYSLVSLDHIINFHQCAPSP